MLANAETLVEVDRGLGDAVQTFNDRNTPLSVAFLASGVIIFPCQKSIQR
jgi:hypothetical protein